MYIRDGRAPIPKSVQTSKVMSANRGKDTKPELMLRKALWSVDVRGYRLHQKNIPGRPDLSFRKRKIAVFVNGCFWHRCPHCNPHKPKSNADFWESKFKNNMRRDKVKNKQLHKLGWKVITVWECQIKNNLKASVKNILSFL